ncbi:hypothetical protein NP493_1681g00012 [Ridgeia piscesae]|uniref:Reverse transcriptase domain-containing protein n=1 Tax=Ridgeia piscesae TaxID=27915 RepID=A0AAD9JV66_RIDPI|nr:hypothetical protein NP493_1681g00012 [Ridgeia piscesae]
MQDVRVQRGADAASDHHLVLARMKMKLKKREVKKSTRTQYNVDFLKDRLTTETFRLTVRNKYETLHDLLDEGNMDIDTQWQQIKEMWTSTCSEVLGKKKYQQKDWISADTLNKVQVRKEKKGAINNSRTRAAKATAQEEYTEANRAVKNSVKTDKANFIEDLAKEAEDASAQGNMKQLYEITRKLAGKYKRTDRPIKDKNGNVLTSDEDQLKRWREHFEELLNRPPPQNPPDITPAEEVLQINCERPNYEKAFDSLDRDTLWKLLQHYGIPNKLISLIRNSYEDMACRVIHAGQLTDSFMVKTRVRQGCLLSPFLFLLAIDWIMKKTTKYRRNGIQWTPWSQLEDLHFADDLALLSHSHQQMQEKTELLNTVSTQLGLNINRSKTRIMKANTKNNNPITMNGEPLEETDSFTYLGSTINKHGCIAEDVKARIQQELHSSC